MEKGKGGKKSGVDGRKGERSELLMRKGKGGNGRGVGEGCFEIEKLFTYFVSTRGLMHL